MKKKTFHPKRQPESPPPSIQNDRLVRIGKIVGVFGLRGGIKVEPLTDALERFAIGNTVYLDGQAHVIERIHLHKQQIRLRLSGIETIPNAQKCVGKYLQALREERPALSGGEYWVDELIGMEVLEESGERLGTLDEVISAPAHDVYRVGSLLIPAVREFILNVDPETRTIIVRLLPGMKPEPPPKPSRRLPHGRKASR